MGEEIPVHEWLRLALRDLRHAGCKAVTWLRREPSAAEPLCGAEIFPTLQDINVYGSLDEQSAAANFLGKTVVEAEELFRQDFLSYYGDLMWMGPRAFCFYVPAAIAYLLSPDADGDSDAASFFCGVLRFRLEYEGTAIASVRPQLRAAVQAIVDQFPRFRDPESYPDFRQQYVLLSQQLQD